MHLLYSTIISPIEYIIEIIYVLMYKYMGNPAYAIFGVSLTVSFLVLPLYLRADAIQEEESLRQKNMATRISHIKKYFHGDEQYMIISAFYRENNYKPIYALRSTLSLLLQIPFFLAAYHYLSNLDVLNGASFFNISDLGSEDGMIPIGKGINLLPILMTVINMTSGFIYTKNKPLKEKIQVYLPAILFLVLLYHSPSGLVIYWTMNNIFSLIKNFVMKNIKQKKLFVKAILCLIGLLLLIYTLYRGVLSEMLAVHNNEGIIFFIAFPLCLMLPLLFSFVPAKLLRLHFEKVHDTSSFIQAELFLVSFLGLMIPLTVISSSAQDFINLFHYRSPLYYVLNSFCVFAGLFFIWGTVIYRMMNETGKTCFSLLLFSLSILASVNYLYFNADMGSCGTRINFGNEPYFTSAMRYGNAILLVILLIACIWLWFKFRPALKMLLITMTLVCLFMSGRMLITTFKDIKTAKNLDSFSNENPEFHLSKNGKNVVVIMLDRAIGAYTPFIMDERPELMEAFDGFIFYPNTVSTGLTTNHGAPGLYGGYDYTTEALTVRSDELMATKHDQALLLMPKLFTENGYKSSIADVPYANYSELSDMSLFDELNNTNAFHYSGRTIDKETIASARTLTERNLCIYSIFRCAPALLQDNIYDHSRYLSLERGAGYYDENFTSAYMGLKNLENYTTFDESGDRLMIYCNNLTHEPYELDPETYSFSKEFDHFYPEDYLHRNINGINMDLTVDNNLGLANYHVNVAAYILLGKWFDTLRKEGVYDNTRIIIVSDHGMPGLTGQFDKLEFNVENDNVNLQYANSLLMVKDFNAKGFSVNEQFMTNADVPAIAMSGLINEPVNPYTGNPIDTNGKKNGINIFWSAHHTIDEKFIPESNDDPWYHVVNDCRVEENWSKANISE